MSAVQPVLLALILLLAPLLYGGNRPLALMALELLALPLLFHAGRAPQALGKLAFPLLFLLALAVLLPLVQLVPIPWTVWSDLPSLQPYAQALQLAAKSAGSDLPEALPASLLPDRTEYALLALLPPLLVFLAVLAAPLSTRRRLTIWLLFVASLQALIGLSQYAAGARASGTYANPDHLAGLLEMTLPVALAMLVAHVGHQVQVERRQRSWRRHAMAWLSAGTSSMALYAFLALVIFLGLIFTKSRSGIGLAIVVVLLSAVAFARRIGGNHAFGAVGAFVTLGAGVAVAAGLVPVLERFTRGDQLQDARWSIFAAMRDAIPAYLPFGSGIGTFRSIFERFQPYEMYGDLVNHAHNDYLEWLMEGGVPAAVIMTGLAAVFLWRWPQLITRGQWRTMHIVQVGAGIGMLAMLLHSLVDFNLRIPANQIVFAFLAALFFGRQEEAALPASEPAEPVPEPAVLAEPVIRDEPLVRIEPTLTEMTTTGAARAGRQRNPFDD